MNSNPIPYRQEDATPVLKGSLARSRSRYKAGRPNKPSHIADSLPSFSSDHTEDFQKAAAPAIRRRQQSISDVAGLEGSSTRAIHEPVNKNETLELSNTGVTQRQQSRAQFWPNNSTRVEKSADIPQPRIGATDLEHDYPIDSQREQKLRKRQGELQPTHMEEQQAFKRPSELNKKSLTKRIARQVDGERSLRDREKLKRTISGPIAVEPHHSTVTPAFDAPISAVNAGERKVAVKYSHSTMWLPVTPSTTSLDILNLANEQLTEPIDVKIMFVVESYRQLGLERPLRKYEHVRDVLNSWDNDSQNTLLIVQSPTKGRDEDLELDCVAKVQPEGTSVSIYHSQRPGHWDKRWVTLRTDGQVLIAKKDGGEATNICHLSDFDIYTPTARQLSKKIRPPRRSCFTVKSQQKSSMFMSTVNFVHFFSTGDKTLAATWYKAVQEWRSWYLVNVMGEGQQTQRSPRRMIANAGDRVSMNGEQMLGSRGRPTNGISDQRLSTKDSVSNRLPLRNRTAPPVSFPEQFSMDAEKGTPGTSRHNPGLIQSPSHNDSEREPFAATSLLGRTYTQRQKAQLSREAKQNLSGPPPALPQATDQSDGLKRSSSRRQMTKPLIDLTPQYREPPQHCRKGRGVIPEQMPAGGLIEIATSPEAAVEIPPATTWQRPTTSGRDHGSEHDMQRSHTVRRDHKRSPSSAPRQTSKSPEKGDVPFASGLLAEHQKRQGATRTGRGVLTGDRQARAPMLDVTEGSKHAYGSLLDQVDRYEGVSRPVVERERKMEISSPVGEAM